VQEHGVVWEPLPTGTLTESFVTHLALTSIAVIPLTVDVASEEIQLPPVPDEIIVAPETEPLPEPYPDAIPVDDTEREATSEEGHSNASSPETLHSSTAADAEAHLLLEGAGEALV
jgi:hypothetical protein